MDKDEILTFMVENGLWFMVYGLWFIVCRMAAATDS
jgi:uncharacterized membrane protein YccF (DUF307 family)